MLKRHSRFALVTGASKGVGRGIALGLAEDGWDVGVNYLRDKDGAESTASRIGAIGQRSWVLQADVGDSEQVRSLFERLVELAEGIDLLVNNA
nr:SDR family NAD(P)-dependent oxidoreductase [Ardenticatenia bacterium]